MKPLSRHCGAASADATIHTKRNFFTIVWIASLALAMTLLLSLSAYAADAKKESTYDRVMRTNTIRCGYINYPPHFSIDPATKKMSGISHDIAEEMAGLLNLKIEWTEELGWANTVEAMRSNRVDAICTGFWQNPVEGKYVGFTMPMYYSAVGAYVRADDKRFGTELKGVNDPGVSISAADGTSSFFIAGRDFPKAKIAGLPNMTDESQMLMEVATGKADITFVETYLGQKFIKNNPGKLKNLVPQSPVRVYGNTFAIPQDNVRFKSMLDSALVQMIYGGRVDRIIRKYEEVPGGIYRVAQPFAQPKMQ